MSVGLDSEGLLAIYADWIAFLREKKGQFAGQLTKLQAKGGGPDKTPPPPVVPLPAAPPSPPPQEKAAAPAPASEAAPSWLFETTSAPEDGEAIAVSAAPDEEGDEWM